jgi:hypothetical protein
MDVRAVMTDSVRSMRAAALPLIARAAVLLLLSALPLSQAYTYEQDGKYILSFLTLLLDSSWYIQGYLIIYV